MRRFVAAVLGFLACVLLPLGVLSTWAVGVVGDTDEYVETVGPLAEDRAVQQETAERLEALVVEEFPLAAAGGPLLRRGALAVVEGPVFPPVWRSANRVAHEELIGILDEGRADPDGKVTVELGGLMQAVLDNLDQTGVLASANVRAPAVSFTVADSETVEDLRTSYRVLEALGFWLPVAWVAATALTLLAARRRLATAARLALGSAITLGLTWLALAIARYGVLGDVPAEDEELATAVWDVVTESLSSNLLTLAAVAAVATVVLWVPGRLMADRAPA